MKKLRAAIEVGAARTRLPDVNTRAGWASFCELLREVLAEQIDNDRCASAVVALHFDDERCDHE